LETYTLVGRKGGKMILPNEKEFVNQVLEIAKIYGYGNLIAHLKRAWAIRLITNSALTYEQALEATCVEAYPLENYYLDDNGKQK
jgi:hypothetical protein